MRRFNFEGHRNISKPDGSTTDSWFRYTCGYCGSDVAGAVVAFFEPPHYSFRVRWLQCTQCANGSVADTEDRVFPSTGFGPTIEGVPDDTHVAYEEARDCMSVGAYTAAELVCRKILMHVAVEKGAKEDLPFAKYITHLESEGFVTPPMKEWVDQIRKIGNAAAHELTPPQRVRAESTVMFTAELLRLVYEMEHLTRRYVEKVELPKSAGTAGASPPKKS